MNFITQNVTLRKRLAFTKLFTKFCLYGIHKTNAKLTMKANISHQTKKQNELRTSSAKQMVKRLYEREVHLYIE